MSGAKLMTNRQRTQVQKRVNYYGYLEVSGYIKRFYPNADVQNLTSTEAQKIITGMKLPSPIIMGVYLRDFK